MNYSSLSYKGYIFDFFYDNTKDKDYYNITAKNIKSNNLYTGKGIRKDIGQYSENLIYEKYFELMSNNVIEIIDKDSHITISFKGQNDKDIDLDIDIDTLLNKEKQKTKIKIINLEEKTLTDKITSLLFFPQDKIIVGYINGNIEIYDATFKNKLFKFENAHDQSVYFFEIKNETSFFSCSKDMKIKLWEIGKEKHLSIISGHHYDSINKIIYSNKLLYSCSLDKSIIIYEEKNNQYIVKNKIIHEYEILSFLLIQNLIISSGPHETKIWKLERKNYTIEKKFNDLGCYGKNALTKINDEIIVIGGKDISLLSLKNKRIIKKIKIDFPCWTILYLENNLLIGGNNEYIKKYDDKDYTEIENIETKSKNIFEIIKFINNKILFYSKNKLGIITYE